VSLISFGTSYVPPLDREISLSGGVIVGLLLGGSLFAASQAMSDRSLATFKAPYVGRPTLELPVESMRAIVFERRR